jgi:hypothetical protein
VSTFETAAAYLFTQKACLRLLAMVAMTTNEHVIGTSHLCNHVKPKGKYILDDLLKSASPLTN